MKPGSERRRTRKLGEEESEPTPVLLIARVGGREAARLLLEAGTAHAGSGPENELVIDDATVSRRHVALELRGGGVLVRDLGSTNGTRYEGAKVKELLVGVGAVLRIGSAVLRVERPSAPPVVSIGRLVSRAPSMHGVIEQLKSAAASNVTILIDGETGSGKEVAARAVHEVSARAAAPLEVLDCGALTASLAASELFGHVRGAFTGADRDRAGAFERARGGTLFLDEIGELPLDLQPLLLRALERREVRRVGAQSYVPVDVRLIAATNRNLEKEVAEGRFREDLLHRLSVVRVTLPPLRERPEDIELIVRAALEELGPKAESASISADTLATLAAYGWPGNVRELRNFVERAVTLSLDLDDVPSLSPSTARGDYRAARARALDAFERDYVLHVLRRHEGNVSKAAKEAGIDRVSLHRLMRKHAIKL